MEEEQVSGPTGCEPEIDIESLLSDLDEMIEAARETADAEQSALALRSIAW